MENGNMKDLYAAQVAFQRLVESVAGDFPVPFDDPNKFQYHMTAMQEEMGEVLKADKRWKTHRNETFIPDEKLDEVSDMYICLFNISIWSGYDFETIMGAVANKINVNNERLATRRLNTKASWE
jgi:hypothetical protein